MDELLSQNNTPPTKIVNRYDIVEYRSCVFCVTLILADNTTDTIINLSKEYDIKQEDVRQR